MTTTLTAQTEPRTALVTGASSGIGEAIARELAAAGLVVAVHGRDEQRTRAVAEDIERQAATPSPSRPTCRRAPTSSAPSPPRPAPGSAATSTSS